jgi:phosphate transport system substrate-binding protein
MMLRLTFSLFVPLLTATPVFAQVKVDKNLPEYKKSAKVSGVLRLWGSDTMNNLVTLWVEGFVMVHPDIRPQIEGKGAATAPPALIAGTTDFGAMSRPMKSQEIAAFKKKYGYPPTALASSHEMLGVFVHKDNPIKGLTLQQLDAIFSKTRKRAGKQIATWGDAGLDGEWATKPIKLFGRNSASGSYGFFRERVMLSGDFRDETKELSGGRGILEQVANDKYGIGYSGIGYQVGDVRAVPLAEDQKSGFVAEEAEQARAGKYPLARTLYLYVNLDPAKELDPLRGEFIRYVFSKPGQMDVVRAGFVPVDNDGATAALKSVGLK